VESCCSIAMQSRKAFAFFWALQELFV